MNQRSKAHLVVAGFVVALALTYGFAAFAFASADWVQGDIAPWLDGILTVTFLGGFGLTAMSWVCAGWLAVRWWNSGH